MRTLFGPDPFSKISCWKYLKFSKLEPCLALFRLPNNDEKLPYIEAFSNKYAFKTLIIFSSLGFLYHMYFWKSQVHYSRDPLSIIITPVINIINILIMMIKWYLNAWKQLIILIIFSDNEHTNEKINFYVLSRRLREGIKICFNGRLWNKTSLGFLRS